MATIKAEKGKIIFETTNGKTNIYDISTQTLYGVRNTPIKKMSSAITDELPRISVILNLYPDNLYIATMSYYKNAIWNAKVYNDLTNTTSILPRALQVADILKSYSTDHYPEISGKDCYRLGQMLTNQHKSVSEWAKTELSDFTKNYNKADYESAATFYDCYTKYIVKLEERKLKEYIIKCAGSFANYVDDNMFGYIRDIINHVDTYPIGVAKEIIYHIIRGGYNIDIISNSGYVINTRARSMLLRYGELCNDMEITTPEHNTNFWIAMGNLEREYQLNKDKILDRKIYTQQMSKKEQLFYEDENYIVIIPTTVAEFNKEGKEQRNCVAGYVNTVAQCRTFVTFIRRKDDPEKAFITCEVDTKGNIRQFLTYGNRYTSYLDDSKKIQDFKTSYQIHLKEGW